MRLMLFDLLFDAGQDLRRLPLSERRHRLEQFFRPSAGPVELSGVIDGDAAHILESVAELGLEGVMANRTARSYGTWGGWAAASATVNSRNSGNNWTPCRGRPPRSGRCPTPTPQTPTG